MKPERRRKEQAMLLSLLVILLLVSVVFSVLLRLFILYKVRKSYVRILQKVEYLCNMFYDAKDNLDLERLFKRYNITLITSDKVLTGVAMVKTENGIDHHYIIMPKLFFSVTTRTMLLHEIGHIVLDHLGSFEGVWAREWEAEYFAIEMDPTYRICPPMVLFMEMVELGYSVITSPVRSLKEIYRLITSDFSVEEEIVYEYRSNLQAPES
jgi:hypothetical protein